MFFNTHHIRCMKYLFIVHQYIASLQGRSQNWLWGQTVINRCKCLLRFRGTVTKRNGSQGLLYEHVTHSKTATNTTNERTCTVITQLHRTITITIARTTRPHHRTKRTTHGRIRKHLLRCGARPLNCANRKLTRGACDVTQQNRTNRTSRLRSLPFHVGMRTTEYT